MNYQAIYNRIIDTAKERDYINGKIIENHHILPRSEGGSNKKINKVELTPKEHHICHLLMIHFGMCLKYCYRYMTSREYVRMKIVEKKKKHQFY